MYHSKQMRKVIEKIISQNNGSEYVKIDDVPNHDPLVIVVRGNTVQVFHYFRQNGDRMYDPEMTFYTDVMDGYGWIPISITQSPVGVYRECTWLTDGGSIQGYAPRLQKELAEFADMWAHNIASQGYVK